MTDILLLIGIVAAYFVALAVMPRLTQKRVKTKFKAIEKGEAGTYDPSQDPHRVMKGEVESYFD